MGRAVAAGRPPAAAGTPHRRRPLPRTAWLVLAAAVVATSGVTATLGIHSVTRDWGFVGAATCGAVAAAAVSLVGQRFRLLASEAVGAGVAGLVVTGILVAGGGVPTPSAARAFFSGITDGWSELLSSTIPADVTTNVRVVALVLAYVGTFVGVEAVARIRQPALAVAGPLAALALTTLLTGDERRLSLIIGAVLVAGALLVGLLQQRAARAEAEGTRRAWRAGTTLTAAAVVAAVAVAAPVVGPRLPLADAEERYSLRDDVVPPWDPLQLPSPLTQLKPVLQPADETDAATDDGNFPVVFEARSSDRPTRFATATLGAYDGVVWTVGSGVDAPSREFVPVGERLPEPPDDAEDPTVVEAEITIRELAPPWLPSPGWPREVRIDDGGSTVVRENVNTGTLAVPTGLAPGTAYEITATVPATLDDGELAARTMTPLPPTVDLTALPPAIRNLAADIIEGRDDGWAQIAALRDRFVDFGFYSVDDTARPGHSYFRISEFLNDPDVVVGYEEQYTAAAALIGRIADLPTRVVVGYEIDAGRYVDDVAEVRADDLTAWIEARVDGVGWVPVDVTPQSVLEPQEQQQQTVPNEVPAPNPPPPPPPPPDLDVAPDNEEQPEEEPDDEEDDEIEPIPGAVPGRPIAGYVVAAGGSMVGLFVLFALVVAGWKWRRRQRRRRAAAVPHRVAGAWQELADRYQEAGVRIPERATPLEAARAYVVDEPSAQTADAELFGLVAIVDRSAWHAHPPGSDAAEEAWQYSDHLVEALTHGRSWPRRARMLLDPRPLWHRDAWQRAERAGRTGDEAVAAAGSER